MRALFALGAVFRVLAAQAQLPPCDVSLIGTPITCPGDDNGTLSVVTGSGGPYAYAWDHDPLATGTTVGGLEPGPYSVTVSDGVGCESVFDTLITDPYVAPLGTMSLTNITCAGNDDAILTFTIDPGPYAFTWAHAPGVTSTTLTNLAPGFYSVIITGGGPCPSIVGQWIDNPNIVILGTTDYCPSDPPILTAQLDWGFQPDIYIWSTGDVTNSIQVVPGTVGVVDVTATDTTLGCVVNAQITLNELSSPTVAFATPDTTCVNVLTLVNTIASTADSLVWRWGTGNYGFSNELNPLINFTQSGWEPVSLQGYDSLGCGSAPLLDSIYAQYQEPAILSVLQDPCTSFVDIVLGSSTDSCAFFIGDSLITNACAGYIRYNMRRYQEYTYTLYATQANGCNDTTQLVVDVRTEPTLFLANAFTPNEDGINDFWPMRVDISDYGFELLVFDRWGTQLWGTIDPLDQWDGTAGGSAVPMGVYPYTMRMRDPCEPTNQITSKGHVTLFR